MFVSGFISGFVIGASAGLLLACVLTAIRIQEEILKGKDMKNEK